MDDLVGGTLLLFVVALLVAAYIAIGLALAAAATIVFGFESLIVGIRGFALTLARGFKFRGGERAQASGTEPAYESYLIGTFFNDFKLALATGVRELGRKRDELFKRASGYMNGTTWPLGLGAVFGCFAGYALAFAAGIVLTIPITLLVLVTIALAWLAAGGLRMLETIRMRIRGAHYECPEDHERFPLPVYVCPGCGAKHRRLLPGRHGVLRRVCECDKVTLPTLQLNGRQKVPMECPDGHPMSGTIGVAQNLPVPLVGGPSSGKSSYLAGALIELERLRSEGRLGLSVVDESRSSFDDLTSRMRSGIRPEKTDREQAPALVAELQANGVPRLLYAYDVAGEVYGSTDKVKAMKFLARSFGLVLLVDPLAIPRVAEDHAEEIADLSNVLRPSPEDPLRVYERVVGTLRESGLTDLSKLPLAVVIGKADAVGIDQEITELIPEFSDDAPRVWLDRHGAGNLVRAIGQEFGRVGWFSCSALGRTPVEGDKRPFTPRGVVDPMLWILRQRGIAPQAASNGKVRQTVTERHAAERATSALPGVKSRTPRPRVPIDGFPPLGWGARAGWGTAISLAVAGIIGLALVIPASAPDTAPRWVTVDRYRAGPKATRLRTRRVAVHSGERVRIRYRIRPRGRGRTRILAVPRPRHKGKRRVVRPRRRVGRFELKRGVYRVVAKGPPGFGIRLSVQRSGADG